MNKGRELKNTETRIGRITKRQIEIALGFKGERSRDA
jgi:hypothetical protein